MTRRLDYPACTYDPDAELVEDDRRLSLGLEPCRALVHGEEVWRLHASGRWMRARYVHDWDWTYMLRSVVRRISHTGLRWIAIRSGD